MREIANVKNLASYIPPAQFTGTQKKAYEVKDSGGSGQDSFGKTLSDAVASSQKDTAKQNQKVSDKKQEDKKDEPVKTDGAQSQEQTQTQDEVIPITPDVTSVLPVMPLPLVMPEETAETETVIQTVTDNTAADPSKGMPVTIPMTEDFAKTGNQTEAEIQTETVVPDQVIAAHGTPAVGDQVSAPVKAVVKPVENTENALPVADSKTSAVPETVQQIKPQAQRPAEPEIPVKQEPVILSKVNLISQQVNQDQKAPAVLNLDQTNQISVEKEEPVTSQPLDILGDQSQKSEDMIRIKVAEPYRQIDRGAAEAMAQKITQNIKDGKQELIIQLTPEHLGKISIKISVVDEGIKVLLSCDNQKTLGLLADKSSGIGKIVENNLNTPVVVEVKEDGYWNQQKNATDQHKNHNQEAQQQSETSDKEDSEDFIQQLRLGLYQAAW